MTHLKSIFIFLFVNFLSIDAVHLFSFPIGGLFNSETDEDSLVVFRNIVDVRTAYHGEPIYPEVADSYSTALDVCRNTSGTSSVIALIDVRPTYGFCDTTCLIANKLNISHLSVGWQLPETLAQDSFTFSYHPSSELISKAYATLIRDLQWDKFTVLYENDESFIRIQEVINTWPTNHDPILYRKLDPEGDNRETFKYIFKVEHLSNHILDCDVNNIKKYFEEIIQVENSTRYQSFILTALDAYMLKLDDIPGLNANVSTLHITIADDISWKDIDDNPRPKRLETALTADALNHLEKAIRTMLNENGIDEEDNSMLPIKFPDPPALCFADSTSDYLDLTWPIGEQLRHALLITKTKGFTGDIEFDEEGKRKNFNIFYSKLNIESKFVYAGYWDSRTDVITKENVVSDRSTARTSDSVIKVASVVGKPYFMIDDSNGTTQFVGYAVDLIDAIFKHINKKHKLDYKPEFYRVDGDSSGNPVEGTKEKKWTGLIGEVLEHNAELGICDLTITSERARAVDFSIPFMSLGISMLFKEPDPDEPDMFSFIKPLSLDVWLYLATTYIIVSFILLICARISQDDWVNPHPCNQNPENLQNIWTLYNCMWLTMGSIMTQGCDILPRAACSRWITGMWWFFVLIFTASYTANMSTFLSNSRRSNDITDIKALAEQNKVTYGAMYNGSTYKFFQYSNDSVFSKIWTVMNSAKPTVFTKTNDEGKDRVLKSKRSYAFFMESAAIEYYRNRNCQLKMVGGKIDSKDYGIAMPKKSTLKGYVDNAILHLQESGELENLKKTWWEDESVKCDDSEKEKDSSGSLQMKNTSGIFLVLGIGGIMGFFVAIIDFLLHVNKISFKEKVPFREVLISEWKASLDPRVLHKSAAPPRSAAPSTGSPTPSRERSQSRAVSVLRAATSFINFDEIY